MTKELADNHFEDVQQHSALHFFHHIRNVNVMRTKTKIPWNILSFDMEIIIIGKILFMRTKPQLDKKWYSFSWEVEEPAELKSIKCITYKL